MGATGYARADVVLYDEKCTPLLGVELKVGSMGVAARSAAYRQSIKYARHLGVRWMLVHIGTGGEASATDVE